jgi:branched-chain amino acid transport system substrate-binding protein
MSPKKKWIFGFVVLFGFFLSLSSLAIAAGKVIKMGAVAPLTGPYVDNGTELKRGIELAVKLQNDAGGVPIGNEKYLIELVWGDSESKVEVGLSVGDKLITVDKIDVVTGFFHSNIFLPAMDKFQAYGIPAVDCCAASLAIPKKIAEKRMDYVFQLSPTTADIIKANCEAAHYYIKPKKIAILNENTDSGRDFTQLTEAWFKKNAPEVKIVYSEFVTQTTEYTTELAKLKASGAEVIIGEIYGAFASAFFEQWYDMRVPAMYVTSGSTTMSQDFIAKHRKQMEGNISNNRWWPAAYTDISLKRMEEYKKQYGKDPTNFAIQAHDGALTVIKAIEMAGSLDKKLIKEALEKGTFAGIWGKKKFTSLGEGHTCPADMVMVQIQDGKKVPIWPLSIAEGKYRPVPPWPWEKK